MVKYYIRIDSDKSSRQDELYIGSHFLLREKPATQIALIFRAWEVVGGSEAVLKYHFHSTHVSLLLMSAVLATGGSCHL